jgi:hypothetical protein
VVELWPSKHEVLSSKPQNYQKEETQQLVMWLEHLEDVSVESIGTMCS